jgi:hypothetical protein
MHVTVQVAPASGTIDAAAQEHLNLIDVSAQRLPIHGGELRRLLVVSGFSAKITQIGVDEVNQPRERLANDCSPLSIELEPVLPQFSAGLFRPPLDRDMNRGFVDFEGVEATLREVVQVRRGRLRCESAWKIDPLPGDIGVQK